MDEGGGEGGCVFVSLFVCLGFYKLKHFKMIKSAPLLPVER